MIHGGDELNVIVYDEKDLTQTVTVLPSGTISYPLIGEVHVGGLTPTQAKSAHPLEKVKNPIGSAKSRLLAQRANAWKTLAYRTCSHY
jgi:hypothetical protein